MTFEEALSMIVDALTDVENYDEALNVIREQGSKSAETDTNYEQKYRELEAKYKARFKEEISSSAQPPSETKPNNEEKKLSIDELDFSGETE